MSEEPPAARAVARPLERKLVLALCLGALLFAAIAGAAQFSYSYNQEIRRSRAALNNLAATVHTSASIAVFVHNEEIARDVIEGLLRNAEILAVSLEGSDGYQILRWRNPALPEWKEPDALAYPLLSPALPGQRIGSIKILTDAELISGRARGAAFQQLLALLAQTAVLAIIMLFAFRRLVGRPLAKLAAQLRKAEPGGRQRIATSAAEADTEIGLLADSVNRYLQASEDAIAAERQLRQRVETMETHYRRIFESTNVGVMVLDMDGRLINGNIALHERILRIASTDEQVHSQDFFAQAFKHPDKAWSLVEHARSSGKVAAADLELHDSGEKPHWAHCLFSIHAPDKGDFHYIECVLYDVTSRREREEMALRTAERDALTDLVNRRGAEAYIDRALADARETGVSITLLYIDLDGFKDTNDHYGHAAGDRALIEVARRFGATLRRNSDLLARLGGDEFIVVTYACDKHSAVVRELAERLISALDSPVALEGNQSVTLGASIGIASFPEDAAQRRALLMAADEAMYAAKKAGKNRYALATEKSPGAEV